jgi:hypothetical protein
MDHLGHGVNAAIGATRTMDSDRMIGNAAQSSLQSSLHCRHHWIALKLPAVISTAVVFYTERDPLQACAMGL